MMDECKSYSCCEMIDSVTENERYKVYQAMTAVLYIQ